MTWDGKISGVWGCERLIKQFVLTTTDVISPGSSRWGGGKIRLKVRTQQNTHYLLYVYTLFN